MEKVSILISSYRYGHFLKEAIESALAQTVPCEVIVMNNGSDDCTAEVIDSYDVKKMYLPERMDWCELLNLMIKEAKGEYIVLLGADDKIEPDFVEKCLNKGGDVIRTGLRTFGDTDIVMIPPEEPFLNITRDNFCYFTSMFKKSVWKEVGGFDEYIPTYEDWDFWIRCYIVGAEFRTVKEPLFWYRSHKGQAMQTTVIPLHDQTLEYIKRKYE